MMPNWCFCTLTVSGDATALSNFLEASQGEVEYDSGTDLRSLSLEALYSAPASVRKNGDWDEWCRTHWGTKWDVRVIDEYIDIEDGYATFEFDSAWLPPIKALMHISEVYPDLSFNIEYREAGVRLYGYAEIEEGIVLSSSED